MRWHFVSLLLLMGCTFAAAQESTVTETQTSNPDETAIRSQLSAYAKAFNEREFSKLGPLLHSDVTYLDKSLELRTESRDALVEQIKNGLEESEDVLKAKIDSLVLDDADNATVTGTTSLGSSEESSDQFTFTVKMVKADDIWLIKSIVESDLVEAIEEPEFVNPISALSWLEGEWQDENSNVTSRIRYLAGGEFLIRTFARDSDYAGFQVVGYDATNGTVRSWSYFADGTFGEGVWSAVDDRFMVKTVQTLPDGRSASGTYVITPQDRDSMTVKLVGHSVNGEPVPSAGEMVVSRVTDEAEFTEDQSEPDQSEPEQSESEQ